MLFTPLWGPRVVYARISHKPSKPNNRGTPKFSISDVGCLFVYVAIGNALFQAVRDDYRFFPTLAMVMPFLGNVFAILMWLLAIRFADDRAVETAQSRVAAILVFFPLAAVAVAHVAVSCLILLSGLEVFSHGFVEGMAEYATSPLIIGCIGLLACAAATIYLLRRTFRVCVVDGTR